MEDSISSIYYHSTAPAAGAPSRCACEDFPDSPSVLSSLTINGGFSLWETARSTGSTDTTTDRGLLPSPPVVHLKRPLHPHPTPSPPPMRMSDHVLSDADTTDLVWHRPPPPPRQPPSPPKRTVPVKASTGAATSAVQAPSRKERPSADAHDSVRMESVSGYGFKGHGFGVAAEDVSTSPQPRCRTARPVRAAADTAR